MVEGSTIGNIPFLIIPLLVAVDQLHKGFQAGVRERHTAKAGELDAVALTAAGGGKALLDIGRDKEGGALGAKVRVELREVDVDSRKVEVPEVDVLVGDFLQPHHKVPRLRVAGDQQEWRDAVSAELPSPPNWSRISSQTAPCRSGRRKFSIFSTPTTMALEGILN